MATPPYFKLGCLNEDYNEDEIDDILGALLTPPAIFHSKESQPEIPATNPNSSLPSTIHSLSNRFPSDLSPMTTYSPIHLPDIPSTPPLLPPTQPLLTQIISPLTNTQAVFTHPNPTQSQQVHVNFNPENDPILEQIKREFETASSVLTQDIQEEFEFDEDLEQEFSQVCSNDQFSSKAERTSTQQSDKEPSPNPPKKSSFPPDITLIPSSVSRLFDQITGRYSDFAFVFSLAAQMCQDLLPMDSFIHLKIGLLLSLASIDIESQRPPMSVIALGKESRCGNLLMTNIGNAARRFISPTDDFTTGKVKDNFVRFGPLQLARTGVCYIGNWNRLKPQLSDKLFKSLENGKLMIEGSTMTMPLQCAIWGYWHAYKHNSSDTNIFNKFFEWVLYFLFLRELYSDLLFFFRIFGIPVILEDRTGEDIVNFLLKQATVQTDDPTVDDLAIPLEELKLFLNVISQRTVDFKDDAADLLQKYFVASRADRPEALTPQAFSVMKQMSESFAKISCRHEVVVIDVIGAIFMAEDVLNQAFGAGAYPPPKFKTLSFIGEIDVYMNSFQKWLMNYIDKF